MSFANEIADVDGLKKAFDGLDGSLNKNATDLLKLIKVYEDLNKATKDSAVTVENLSKAQKATSDASKQKDAIDKQIIATTEKLTAVENGSIKPLLEKKIALQAATKAQMDEIKAEGLAETSLVRMRQKLAELTKEYDKAGTRTKAAADEINSLSKEIGEAEKATNRGQREVGQYGKMWEGLKGLLPIVSIAAIGTAIVGTFNAIKNSTETTANAFQFSMNGLSTGLDFFWKTLATGDWSNFMKGLTDAITAGYKYAEMIDRIEDQTRALSALESDKLQENIDLEIALRNKTLTNEDRKKAGEKRIANENEFVKERTQIAEDLYKTELNEALRQTKMTQEQLETVAKDIRSKKLLDAEAYNNSVEALEKKRQLNVKTVGTGYGTATIKQGDTPEILAMQATIDATDKGVKDYAKLIKDFDIITDESKKKYVDSYIAKNQAAVSGKEQTKKIISQVNMLTQAMIDEDIKNAKEATAKAKIATEKRVSELETSSAKEKIIINKRHIDGLTSTEQYQAELLSEEMKFLDKKQALYKKDSKEWNEVETAKQDKQIKINDDLLKATKDKYDYENQLGEEANKLMQDRLDEQLTYDEKIKKEQADLTKRREDEEYKTKKESAKKLRDVQIEFATQAVNAIFTLNNQKLDKELDDLETEKEAKLNNKNLTESQKAKIEADYEKKSAAVKTKQAQNDKKQALFNIAVETAKGAIKAVAESPATFGLPFLPWVIGMGLLEAGLVMAQPIPKFKDGVESAPNRGIFGEAGRELMFTRSGETILAEKPTYFDGDKFKGAKIYSNLETERMMSMVSDRNIIVKNQHDTQLFDQMKRVEDAIINKPVMIMNNEYKVIGQGTSSHQQVIINRLLRNN